MPRPQFVHRMQRILLDDSNFKMALRKPFKERDIHSKTLCLGTAHEGGQLLVIANENKFICAENRTNAHRLGELSCFIHDAKIEGDLSNEGMINTQARASDYQTRSSG